MDTAKGWKTFLFNLAMAALASPDFLALIPADYALYITVIGNLILRTITDSPVGFRK